MRLDLFEATALSVGILVIVGFGYLMYMIWIAS